MGRRVVTCCLLLLAGCAGEGERQDPPAARDLSAPADEPGPARPSTPRAPAEPRGEPAGDRSLAAGFGDAFRPLQTWQDKSEGTTATLVYVTRMGQRTNARPAVIIFSSDPTNDHFRRETTATITVRRLYKDEMRRLLASLDEVGLGTLPWQGEADLYAKIGPARALHLYRDRERRFVLREGLDPDQAQAFRRVQDKLIKLTLAR